MSHDFDRDRAASELEHVFVYGTLKRGQCRANCWPKTPRSIRDAWTFGKLIDLGPYPALLVGSDRVWGELWSFEAEEIPIVHRALDIIEVTNQPGVPNEYDRVRVLVTLADGEQVLASSYRYAGRDQAAQAKHLQPFQTINDQLYVAWPRTSVFPN